MNLLSAAQKFGGYAHRRREEFDFLDTMLYGSIARGSATPGDIDILLFHRNPVLERIALLRGQYGRNDVEKFQFVLSELRKAGYPSIDDLMEIPECKDTIIGNKLHLLYLQPDFFSDEDYLQRHAAFHRDTNFLRDIFADGLLWNDATQEFDIPTITRYAVPENPVVQRVAL